MHTVIQDPDDETGQTRLFGTPKSNLGRTDLPSLAVTIAGHLIDTAEGRAGTARLEWGEERTGTIHEAMRRAADLTQDRSATQEAEWLADYITSKGGQVPSADAKKRPGAPPDTPRRHSAWPACIGHYYYSAPMTVVPVMPDGDTPRARTRPRDKLSCLRAA